uniref:Ketoreductase domain-containing protein n=1 Tax=Plectus sambesii TaxID=2011161 RepID=A0A914WN64_9BILA
MNVRLAIWITDWFGDSADLYFETLQADVAYFTTVSRFQTLVNKSSARMAGRPSLGARIARTIAYLFQLLFCSIWKDLFHSLSWKRKCVQDQVIVITGGAMGIGKRLAEMFALEYKAKVVILDQNEAEALKTVAGIRDCGATAHSFVCDVTNPDDLRQCAAKIAENPALGKADIIICNAGISGFGLILDVSDAMLKKTLDVNVLGVFNTIRAFLGPMISRNQGHVVTIGSICGFAGDVYGSAYCSSKYAVRGIMESLENELHDRDITGVKCTTVYPYFTETAMVTYEPTSTFYNVIPLDKCISSIVDAVLKEKRTSFIPSTFFFIFYIVKPFLSKHSFFASRKWLNFRYGPPIVKTAAAVV